MAFRFLLLFLLCLSTSVRVGAPLVRREPEPRNGSSAGGSADAAIQVNFTLQRVFKSAGEFVEGDFCNEGLDRPNNVTLELFFRVRDSDGEAGEWQHLQTISSELPNGTVLDHSMSAPLGEEGTQFAILQLDHAGGSCGSWGIAGLMNVNFGEESISVMPGMISCASSQSEEVITDDGTVVTAYSLESSSSLRGLRTHWLLLTAGGSCVGGDIEDQFSLPDLPPPVLCNRDSSPPGPYIDLSFLIHWAYDGTACNMMNLFSEGVELSLRRPGDLLWRPLAFFVADDSHQASTIDLDYADNNLKIRGYNVPHVIVNNSDIQHYMQLRICDGSILESGVQFRWLQTVKQNTGSGIKPRDTWSLDDVRVTASLDNNCSGVTVFSDDFEGGGISPVQWPAQRRLALGLDEDICNDGRNGSAAWFGNFTKTSLQSRMIATRTLDLRYSAVCSRCTVEPLHSDGVLSPCFPSVPPPLPEIDLDEELSNIFNLLYSDLSSGLNFLLHFVEDEAANINETQVVYLISTILDILGDQTVSEDFSEVFIGIAGWLTAAVRSRVDLPPTLPPSSTPLPSSQDGSILLKNLDQFALNNHNPIYDDVITDYIELTVRSGNGEGVGEEVMVIDDGALSLSLPGSLFSRANRDTVYARSFLYRNMSGFLNNSLPGNSSSNSLLLGPVLSSFLHSTNKTLDNAEISPPVRITFPYPDSMTSIPTCVFWKFGEEDGGFRTGSWDVRGCVTQRDGSIVTCECNHLTHFALLLSPGIETNEGVTLSLQVIGIVGVSVSLVALALTIITFIAFRSLWSMRNYIHIQLCVCLFVAQLLFVVGVEPRSNEAACSAVAVLLHYAFLVCFMWMLMEGVVLYVALVRVFVEHHLRYIIAFTATSYGVPLLYMVVCIPLGFALKDSEDKGQYGSAEACWLRYDTHFIWAFIAPVLLIIVVNVGFFVMAMVIMCRHQRRQTHQTNVQKIKHWMKVSVSLVVVMGITWVIGVLVFTDSLLPLAYIFTIFVAFQGLIIFILLVVLSKQVHDTYGKWWKVRVVNSEFFSKHLRDRSISKTSMTHIWTSASSHTEEKRRNGSELSNDGRGSGIVLLTCKTSLNSSSGAPSTVDPDPDPQGHTH